ncbi:MAG: sugar phosphate isomerase/epimerase family protein [Anaerolineae bacterium]
MLGFRTAGFRNARLAEALDAIAGAGYGCVELCLEYHGLLDAPVAEVSRLAAESRGRGLPVSSLSYHGDGEPPAVRWGNIGRGLELAAACGVPILVLNGDKLVGVEDPPPFAEVARPLVERAAQLGVLLAVEPEPGLTIADTAQMQAALQALPSPPLAVNLDVGHAFLTDDLAETFRTLGRHVVHLHVEGMQAGVHRHLLPGDGDLDFGLVARLAADIGYEGPWVVDLFSADTDPFQYCGEALRRLKQVLADGA